MPLIQATVRISVYCCVSPLFVLRCVQRYLMSLVPLTTLGTKRPGTTVFAPTAQRWNEGQLRLLGDNLSIREETLAKTSGYFNGSASFDWFYLVFAV